VGHSLPSPPSPAYELAGFPSPLPFSPTSLAPPPPEPLAQPELAVLPPSKPCAGVVDGVSPCPGVSPLASIPVPPPEPPSPATWPGPGLFSAPPLPPPAAEILLTDEAEPSASTAPPAPTTTGYV